MDSMSEDLFALLWVIVPTLLLVFLTKNYLRMLSLRKHFPPGPVPLPLLGTLYTLPLNLSNLPFYLDKMSKKYGGMWTFQGLSGRCSVVLSDPVLIKEAFVKSADSAGRTFSTQHKFSQQIFNPYFPETGVVFGDYDEQQKLQRHASMVVLRSLGYGKKSIENKILEEADHLVASFKEFRGSSFQTKPLLENAVANIICSLLFGKRYQYGDKEFAELQHCIDKIFEFIGTCALIDEVWFVKYIPSQRRKIEEFRKHTTIFNRYVSKKIEETKQSMKDEEETSNFISAYLKEVENSNGKLQDRSHQLVKDFFAAGAETTSTTLGWMLYFMLKYPDVQRKIRDEINRNIGEGVKPTLKDREKLPYTEATIAEVLRVCPTAPTSLPHRIIADTEIGGYRLPRKTGVTAITLPTTWNEKMFPEPHILKPERHLDKDGQFVKNENLMPFGVGRRSCLGEQLAKQELFLFFTHLVQCFEFRLPDGESLPEQRGNWFLTYRPPVYNLIAVPIN